MTVYTDKVQYDGLTKHIEILLKELETEKDDVKRNNILNRIEQASKMREKCFKELPDPEPEKVTEPKHWWEEDTTRWKVVSTVLQVLTIVTPVISAAVTAKINASTTLEAARIHESGRNNNLRLMMQYEKESDDFVNSRDIDTINKLSK